MNTGYNIAHHTFSATPPEAALYVVSTPIGNLGDMTIRALETLAAVELIACEDTRNTARLLQRYAIQTPMTPCHDHNEEKAAQRVLKLLQDDKPVALVCDAGTPLVSDPGYRLVNLVRQASFKVIPVPGASALLAALVASGLPSDRHTFAGFLPHKAGARRSVLGEFTNHTATTVFYESPNRLMASLADMQSIYGANRKAAICRELTKLHEETVTGTLAELCGLFGERTIKGEIVILLAPADEQESGDPRLLMQELLGEMSVSRAAARAAELTGQPRRELYQLALQISGEGGD